MPHWATRVAYWLSLLWATMFLSVSLVHPLTHNPLQHDGGDCLVCVLQKTPAPEPPALHETLNALADRWSAEPLRLNGEIPVSPSDPCIQPLIPRAPPA